MVYPLFTLSGHLSKTVPVPGPDIHAHEEGYKTILIEPEGFRTQVMSREG